MEKMPEYRIVTNGYTYRVQCRVEIARWFGRWRYTKWHNCQQLSEALGIPIDWDFNSLEAATAHMHHLIQRDKERAAPFVPVVDGETRPAPPPPPDPSQNPGRAIREW